MFFKTEEKTCFQNPRECFLHLQSVTSIMYTDMRCVYGNTCQKGCAHIQNHTVGYLNAPYESDNELIYTVKNVDGCRDGSA